MCEFLLIWIGLLFLNLILYRFTSNEIVSSKEDFKYYVGLSMIPIADIVVFFIVVHDVLVNKLYKETNDNINNR